MMSVAEAKYTLSQFSQKNDPARRPAVERPKPPAPQDRRVVIAR